MRDSLNREAAGEPGRILLWGLLLAVGSVILLAWHPIYPIYFVAPGLAISEGNGSRSGGGAPFERRVLPGPPPRPSRPSRRAVKGPHACGWVDIINVTNEVLGPMQVVCMESSREK